MAAESARVRLTYPARERMAERDVTMREVLTVLRHGTLDEEPVPALNPPGRWTARMSNRAGLAVVVGLDPDDEPFVLNVVTVMKRG